MKYIKQDIENMLREHSKNEAKIIEIKLKEEEYEERLRYSGTVYQESKDEVIERMQLKGINYDYINNNGNIISDKTSKVALTYNEDMNFTNEEDRKFVEGRLIECKRLRTELNKKIQRVENLLSVLNKKQNFIITEYYINDEKRKLVKSGAII